MEDSAVWELQGGLKPLADLAAWPRPPKEPLRAKVEVLLPPWIISEMEKLTEHRSPKAGLAAPLGFPKASQLESPRFVEHSKVVSSWDVLRQRCFGGRLLRQMIPEPLARLFAAILNALKLRKDLHRSAIRPWALRAVA